MQLSTHVTEGTLQRHIMERNLRSDLHRVHDVCAESLNGSVHSVHWYYLCVVDMYSVTCYSAAIVFYENGGLTSLAV